MKKFLGLTVEQAQVELAKAFDHVKYEEKRIDYTDGTFDIECGFYVLDDHVDFGFYFYVEDGILDDWTDMWPWEMDF